MKILNSFDVNEIEKLIYCVLVKNKMITLKDGNGHNEWKQNILLAIVRMLASELVLGLIVEVMLM